MLDDAELLLGMSRHLAAYGMAPANAALEGLARIGQAYEMAWRLRESQISSAERVRAIAVEARVGARTLDREVLPSLESLGWVRTQRHAQAGLVSVDAFIPPVSDLIAQSSRLLDIYLSTPVERAALLLLRATSVQPLEKEAALQAASSAGDEASEEALRHLVAVNLVREALSDDGRTVVFNPNVWIGNTPDLVDAALRAETLAPGNMSVNISKRSRHCRGFRKQALRPPTSDGSTSPSRRVFCSAPLCRPATVRSGVFSSPRSWDAIRLGGAPYCQGRTIALTRRIISGGGLHRVRLFMAGRTRGRRRGLSRRTKAMVVGLEKCPKIIRHII